MTDYWEPLRQPHGSIVFAGEHTAALDVTYMNGAIESGVRAARGVERKEYPNWRPRKLFSGISEHVYVILGLLYMVHC